MCFYIYPWYMEYKIITRKVYVKFFLASHCNNHDLGDELDLCNRRKTCRAVEKWNFDSYQA